MAEMNRMEVDGYKIPVDVPVNRDLKEQQTKRVRGYLSGQRAVQETDSDDTEYDDEVHNRDETGQRERKEEDELKQYDEQKYKAVKNLRRAAMTTRVIGTRFRAERWTCWKWTQD